MGGVLNKDSRRDLALFGVNVHCGKGKILITETKRQREGNPPQSNQQVQSDPPDPDALVCMQPEWVSYNEGKRNL